MTTALEVCQEVVKGTGFDTPTTLVGNSEQTAIQLLALLNLAGKRIAKKCDWTVLQVEHTFSTVASTAAYAIPSDFDHLIGHTQWDRSNSWPIFGPLSPQEWQLYKSGIVTSINRKRFRIKGGSSTTFYLDPTPTVSSETLVFEYVSKGWITAVAWVTGTAYAALAYVSYNGNRYQTTSGGTSGATAPTHTTGSTSDGGVTWTYLDHGANKVIADADVLVVDDHLIALDLRWRWLEAKGYDYTAALAEANAEIDRSMARDGGNKMLSINPAPPSKFVGYENYPDTGFG